MRGRTALVIFAAAASVGAIAATCASTQRTPLEVPPLSAAPPLPKARAFRIAQPGDLIVGPAATGTIGDFRLENEQVAFVVTDAPIAFGFADSGGNLVDAARRGGRDSISQIFLYLDETFPRQALYDSVTVGRAEGDLASIVSTGHDSADPRVHIVTEYLLHAADGFLTIRTTITNTGPTAIAGYEIGDAISWGQAEHFAPGFGFLFGTKIEAPWLAGVGDGVGYGYTARKGTLGGTHGSSWSDPILGVYELAPGLPVAVERYLIVGARGDVASVVGRIHALRDEETATLSGLVSEDGGAPLANARVEVWDASGKPCAIAESGDDGAYAVKLPIGDYRLGVGAPGRTALAQNAGGMYSSPDPTAVHLPHEGARHDFTVGKPSTIRYHVTADDRPGGSPAKLTFKGVAPTTDPYFGARYRAAGAANVVLTPSGDGTITVPPGTYTIYVSRGIEYDLGEQQVPVAAGETALLTVELHHVVDTTGYLSGDFHQHAIPSPDSSVALGDRVVANLAEGVEVAIATDHNQITDYAAAAAIIAADAPLRTVVGLEATTETEGHFNAYPLTRHPRAGRGGAPNVHEHTVPEIFAMLRGLESDIVLQVNHPRSGKSGYFDYAGFDPAAADAQGAKVDLGFDALEVVNGKRIDSFPRTLRDWFWLLSHGHIVTAMGNSDSHAIVGEECGYPRNFLGAGTDDPRALTDDALREIVKQKRDIIVSNGPFVTVREPGTKKSAIGRTFVRRPREAFDLDITVQAAPWVDVTRVEIYANGALYGKPIAVKTPRTDVVRYHATQHLAAQADTYFVIVVRGDASLEPVLSPSDFPVTPVALTNPIWLSIKSPK